MPSKRPRTRFQDIIYNVEAIRRYTKGLTKKTFVTEDLVVDAVERCLSRISEAAKKLGKQAETLAPDQPWKKIRGLGNFLRRCLVHTLLLANRPHPIFGSNSKKH